MQDTWVQSLGQENPLEKVMATHSSILNWEIQWAEKPGGLQYTESQKSQDTATKQQKQLKKLHFNSVQSLSSVWETYFNKWGRLRGTDVQL